MEKNFFFLSKMETISYLPLYVTIMFKEATLNVKKKFFSRLKVNYESPFFCKEIQEI